jgi:glutathione S-transferase
MTKIELFTAMLCPFALRVRLALAQKGVQAEEIEINPQNRPSWFVEMTPPGKVPVLRHGGALVWDSAVICEYLEEVFPQHRLLPENSPDRARARMWIKFADARLYAKTEALLHGMDRKKHAVLLAELAESLLVLEREAWKDGTQGPYWMGAEPGLTDFAFYPWFEQLCVLERYFGFQTPPGCRHIPAWRRAMTACKAVQAVGKPPGFYLEAYDRLIAA